LPCCCVLLTLPGPPKFLSPGQFSSSWSLIPCSFSFLFPLFKGVPLGSASLLSTCPSYPNLHLVLDNSTKTSRSEQDW
jgi:hypothetical protein